MQRVELAVMTTLTLETFVQVGLKLTPLTDKKLKTLNTQFLLPSACVNHHEIHFDLHNSFQFHFKET